MDYPSDPDIYLHEGKFTDGDPENGVPASADPASHANALTDELINLIEASGQTPAEGDLTQVAKAVRADRPVLLCTDSGTSSIYSLTPVDGIVPPALNDGLVVIFKATSTCNASPDIRLGALPQEPLSWPGGSIITTGKIKAGQYCTAVYTSGRFELISRSGNKDSVFVTQSAGLPSMSGVQMQVELQPQGAWISVGPTGSGADYIWPALNNFPVDADWIKLRIVSRASSIGGTPNDDHTCTLYARKNGSTADAVTDSTIMRLESYVNSNGYAKDATAVEHTIPVNNRMFDVRWATEFITINVIFLYLVGGGHNKGVV